MPNIHMQSAISDINKAVSDIKQKQLEIRSDTENEKHSIDERINKIHDEQKQLNVLIGQTENSAEKTVLNTKISSLEHEASDLNNNRFRIEDDAKKQIQQFDNNISELEQIISRIQAVNY